MPDPHSPNDLVAALLGGTLFPPLYVRAIDGLLEPRLAIGAPHETKLGLRVDLPAWLRQSDVVSSISAAKAGGARLALKDLPVPRLDGYHGVLFPGLSDVEHLVRKLATPLAGIARIEPRRTAPTGNFDLVLEEKESIRLLRLTRRPLSPLPGIPKSRGLQRFELEGSVDLEPLLRSFERGDTDLCWLSDGLFSPRPGSRTIDLGALAYLAVRAGNEVAELARPGAVLSLIDAIAPDRMGHLGLLRRGHCAPSATKVDMTKLAPGAPIMVRASSPIAVAAAEILAREIGGVAQPVDPSTFDRVSHEGRFALLIDVVRAVDESEGGAALAVATFDGSAHAPPAGAGPRTVASTATAALGWEISLIGAEAPRIWISRSAFGGLDLEAAAES